MKLVSSSGKNTQYPSVDVQKPGLARNPGLAKFKAGPSANHFPKLRPKDVIDNRYRILEQIGEGGCAIVYSAIDKRSGEKVALKLAIGDITMLDTFNKSLKNEGRTLARFDPINKPEHKNIVGIKGEGTLDDGRVYLVLEYVDGYELTDELVGIKFLPWERTKSILKQVCHALAAVHDQDLVHRDIKFDNIMLRVKNGKETVKLLDFGLTVEFGHSDEPGKVRGSIFYLAPEQILARPLHARTDVYAFGSLLYRMICGVFPFTGPGPLVILKHLRAIPKHPSEQNPLISKELDDVVMRALEKKPENRFQSIREMWQAIECI